MIHENLKEYLDHKGIADKDFAKSLGISKNYLSLLKHGHRRPGPKLARKITALTGIPLRWLLFPDETSKVRDFVLR